MLGKSADDGLLMLPAPSWLPEVEAVADPDTVPLELGLLGHRGSEDMMKFKATMIGCCAGSW
jgi:hypothetical protein